MDFIWLIDIFGGVIVDCLGVCVDEIFLRDIFLGISFCFLMVLFVGLLFLVRILLLLVKYVEFDWFFNFKVVV